MWKRLRKLLEDYKKQKRRDAFVKLAQSLPPLPAVMLAVPVEDAEIVEEDEDPPPPGGWLH